MKRIIISLIIHSLIFSSTLYAQESFINWTKDLLDLSSNDESDPLMMIKDTSKEELYPKVSKFTGGVVKEDKKSCRDKPIYDFKSGKKWSEVVFSKDYCKKVSQIVCKNNLTATCYKNDSITNSNQNDLMNISNAVSYADATDTTISRDDFFRKNRPEEKFLLSIKKLIYPEIDKNIERLKAERDAYAKDTKNLLYPLVRRDDYRKMVMHYLYKDAMESIKRDARLELKKKSDKEDKSSSKVSAKDLEEQTTKTVKKIKEDFVNNTGKLSTLFEGAENQYLFGSDPYESDHSKHIAVHKSVTSSGWGVAYDLKNHDAKEFESAFKPIKEKFESKILSGTFSLEDFDSYLTGTLLVDEDDNEVGIEKPAMSLYIDKLLKHSLLPSNVKENKKVKLAEYDRKISELKKAKEDIKKSNLAGVDFSTFGLEFDKIMDKDMSVPEKIDLEKGYCAVKAREPEKTSLGMYAVGGVLLVGGVALELGSAGVLTPLTAPLICSGSAIFLAKGVENLKKNTKIANRNTALFSIDKIDLKKLEEALKNRNYSRSEVILDTVLFPLDVASLRHLKNLRHVKVKEVTDAVKKVSKFTVNAPIKTAKFVTSTPIKAAKSTIKTVTGKKRIKNISKLRKNKNLKRSYAKSQELADVKTQSSKFYNDLGKIRFGSKQASSASLNMSADHVRMSSLVIKDPSTGVFRASALNEVGSKSALNELIDLVKESKLIPNETLESLRKLDKLSLDKQRDAAKYTHGSVNETQHGLDLLRNRLKDPAEKNLVNSIQSFLDNSGHNPDHVVAHEHLNWLKKYIKDLKDPNFSQLVKKFDYKAKGSGDVFKMQQKQFENMMRPEFVKDYEGFKRGIEVLDNPKFREPIKALVDAQKAGAKIKYTNALEFLMEAEPDLQKLLGDAPTKEVWDQLDDILKTISDADLIKNSENRKTLLEGIESALKSCTKCKGGVCKAL